MKRVGFYINNSQFPKVDCSHIEYGNPGIGGSEFLILLVASLLSRRDNDIEVYLYCQINGILPEGPRIILVQDGKEAILRADRSEVDTFVIDQKNVNWKIFPFESINSYMQLVLWCHNFIYYKKLEFLAAKTKISKLVFVGREQLDLYRDCRGFNKCDYIYNCVPENSADIELVSKITLQQRKPYVVFVGSLSKDKSFDVLASLWPRIKEKVPGAELFVIGSGKLYDKNAEMGMYRITDSEYEKKFMPYLTDNHGNVLPSVHFLGNLGVEKNKILMQAKVGCPNPLGRSETFCLSAVEMQMMGVTVIATEAPGYLDTFYNGSIAKTKKQLLDYIIKQLKSSKPIKEYNETLSYFRKTFGVEVIIQDWEKLIQSDYSRHLHPLYPMENISYRWKKHKDTLRIIKVKYPILQRFVPSLLKWDFLLQKLHILKSL